MVDDVAFSGARLAGCELLESFFFVAAAKEIAIPVRTGTVFFVSEKSFRPLVVAEVANRRLSSLTHGIKVMPLCTMDSTIFWRR